MRKPPALPKPDKWGSFWFGSRRTDPAVFPSRVMEGKFLAFVSPEKGFLCVGYVLSYFDTAQDALDALIAAGAFPRFA